MVPWLVPRAGQRLGTGPNTRVQHRRSRPRRHGTSRCPSRWCGSPRPQPGRRPGREPNRAQRGREHPGRHGRVPKRSRTGRVQVCESSWGSFFGVGRRVSSLFDGVVGRGGDVVGWGAGRRGAGGAVVRRVMAAGGGRSRGRGARGGARRGARRGCCGRPRRARNATTRAPLVGMRARWAGGSCGSLDQPEEPKEEEPFAPSSRPSSARSRVTSGSGSCHRPANDSNTTRPGSGIAASSKSDSAEGSPVCSR